MYLLSLGDNHPDTLTAMCNYAGLLGRYGAAHKHNIQDVVEHPPSSDTHTTFDKCLCFIPTTYTHDPTHSRTFTQ